MINRRDALKTIFSSTAAAGVGAGVWGIFSENTMAADLTLRPPGAIENEEFIKACIKCGKCVEACPYDTLLLASPTSGKGNGMPYFTPRVVPCYLCANMPCIEACPSGALDSKELCKTNPEKPIIEDAKIGLAVINADTCIAYSGIQCDACYRACPKLDKAITLEYSKNEATQKHSNIKPIIHADECTGCGICEHVCVVQKSAIHVLPIEIAMGEIGNHYIKSWDENDELRLQNMKQKENTNSDVESALDYLNTDEELFD